MKNTIRIIITGGTFDKAYDPLKGGLTFKHTHLPEILETIRCTHPVELEISQLIDSLDMNMENRKSVLKACGRAEESMIIIIHGTDTMVKTAKLIGAAGLDKTVVLTGAMVPYSVTGSDAMFNLGCAFTAVQTLPHGVFIAMNGKVFPWKNVRKDREKGVFTTLK